MNKFTRIILLPVYNEENTLEEELNKLLDKGDVFIIVNDGSTDISGDIILKWIENHKKTLQIDSTENHINKLDSDKVKHHIEKHIKSSGDISGYKYLAGKSRSVIYIEFPVNKGKSSALQECFKIILSLYEDSIFKGEDTIIVTDADGQLPADIISSATNYLKKENLDMLIGRRDFTSYPLFKRLGNYFLSRLAAILTGFNFHDTQCGFRIFTISVLEKILPYYHARGYSCEQELSLIPVLLGMKLDNTFPVEPVYYRSNSTITDAFYITLDSFATWLKVKKGLL
ncbi:MAG: glycosyltransferase family 2 protein [Candidatus Eremiobacteraeota bacterium]|nr:glycosyltransferase family 2 protein [Candidatus Eremiobacteraeota bacterium]